MILKFLVLYFTFFKIGLFSFGGGYAVLSLMQQEIIYTNNWITLNEFIDIVAVSQITPGPISVNAATYVGYSVTNSFFGAVVATLGLASPSIIIMYIFSKFFLKLKKNKYIENSFMGLKYIVVALILSVGVSLINNKNFLDIKSYIIFLVSFYFLITTKISPIILIVVSAILGIVLY